LTKYKRISGDKIWGRPHYSLRKGRGLEKEKENRIFAPVGRKAKFIRD
jgi:hypothetical protein